VFAVREQRHDPQPFLTLQALFHHLQARLSATPAPRGASSFGALRREAAALVASAATRHGNVGAVLAAAGARVEALPCAGAARQSGGSRLGSVGHLSEAIASLSMTGALTRLSLIAAVGAALLGGWLLARGGHLSGAVLLASSLACVICAAFAHLFRRRVLASLRRPPLRAQREPLRGKSSVCGWLP
jgi:hypothetical protein